MCYNSIKQRSYLHEWYKDIMVSRIRSSMTLELKEYRDGLIFEKEYNLNTRTLEINLLIIKKEAGLRISNEIGEFFRGP